MVNEGKEEMLYFLHSILSTFKSLKTWKKRESSWRVNEDERILYFVSLLFVCDCKVSNVSV